MALVHRSDATTPLPGRGPADALPNARRRSSATAARRLGDPDVTELVDRLLEASSDFSELCNEHDVAVRRSDHKRILHPEVGLLDLMCDVLVSVNDDQRLVVLFARPGTDTRDELELLRVIGLQDLSTGPDHVDVGG